MHRILIPPSAVQGDAVVIRDAAILHHVCHVLRLSTGSPLECLDGRGRRYVGTIAQRSPQALVLAITRRAEEPLARPEITVALALIQPQRYEWFIQKSTELGAARLMPMLTARTTIRATPGRLAARQARWRRIVESAAAQCGRAAVPPIDPPRRFSEVLARVRGSLTLMPTLADEGVALGEALAGLRGVDRATLLIGPEGDFTPEEVREATQAGAQAVRLGPLTLRSETAALAALVVLQYAAGRW